MCIGGGSSWAYVVDVAPDPATGKRRQKTQGGFSTKAAASKAMRTFLVEQESGRAVGRNRTQLSDYLEQWLGQPGSLTRSSRIRTLVRARATCSLLPGECT